jgi:hypothetical protein
MNRTVPIILLAMPVAAHAEVSDKMATIPQLWMQGIIIAVVLLALVRWSVWFSILAFAVISFFGAATYDTFADPYVGPAILNEQGIPYVASSYGSVLLMFVGWLVGIWFNRRKQKNGT